MLVKNAEPALREILERKNQPQRWKDGMAKLAVDQLREKTAPSAFFRKHYISSLTEANLVEGFITKNRGYRDYNDTFRPYIGQDIIGLLCDIASSRKNRPLRILDDGAGHGNFLGNIKAMLKMRGISAKTTSMSLTASPLLEANGIDIAYEGSSVMVLPEEKQDLIISNMGTLWYQSLELQKEIILKHAYTLTKGGHLLLMTHGIAVDVLDPFPSMLEKVGRSYERIKRTLEKRGFEVMHAGDAKGHGMLVVKRLS